MNTKLFSEAMNQINDRYYEEAARYEYRRRTHGWVKWSVVAACLAIVVFTAFSVLPNYLNQQGDTPPNAQNGGTIADNPNDNTPLLTSKIHISMDNIFLNEIAEVLDEAKRWYDPKLYDNIVWDKGAVIDYYKKDLTPAYVPDGLVAAPGNGTATVITDKSGKVVEDIILLGFYHEYYEDGSPKLTENIAALKGFSITASKIGLLNDCRYLLPENKVKTSKIAGISVTFGYRSMPYGPYDPDTHEPSGYYDMYAAEFKQDGIEYEIVADQMEIEELVKVVSSIICGEEVVIDN